MFKSLVLVVSLVGAVRAASAQQTPLAVRVPGFGESAPPLPLFLRASEKTQGTGFNQRYQPPRRQTRQCPMPIYHPDTSFHDPSLPVVRLGATVDPGILVEIECPNPLDTKVVLGPFARTDSASVRPTPARF